MESKTAIREFLRRTWNNAMSINRRQKEFYEYASKICDAYNYERVYYICLLRFHERLEIEKEKLAEVEMSDIEKEDAVERLNNQWGKYSLEMVCNSYFFGGNSYDRISEVIKMLKRMMPIALIVDKKYSMSYICIHEGNILTEWMEKIMMIAEKEKREIEEERAENIRRLMEQ
jgi:hypothetical protein